MEQINAIIFQLPYFILISLLVLWAIVGTVISLYQAYVSKDYSYIKLVTALTFLTAIVGWTLGGYIG